MSVSIRPVRTEDAAEIVDLLNSIIRAGIYTVMAEPFSIDDQIDFIHRFPQRGIYHAAVCDDTHRIVGIQDIVPIAAGSAVFRHVAEISTFIALDAHRRGIGRALSQATFRAAKEQGFKKIMATIRGDNPLALSFYQSQGFKPVGTAHKHVFIQGKYIDEVLMEKFIE